MHTRLACESLAVVLSLCGMTLLRGAALPSGTREVLAQFETGATQPKQCAGDFAVGSHKEVSRFQILPSVWREYSRAENFRDPNAAWIVTQRILREREVEFRRATGRDWDATDLYLMWNAPGVYRRAQWDRTKVSRVVLERAKRFESLMQERWRLQSGPLLARN